MSHRSPFQQIQLLKILVENLSIKLHDELPKFSLNSFGSIACLLEFPSNYGIGFQ